MLFDDLNKCLRKNEVLPYDEACLDIYNFLNETVTIFYQYEECHNCDFQNLTTINPNNFTSVVAKTSSPLEMFYSTSGKMDQCRYCNMRELRGGQILFLV